MIDPENIIHVYPVLDETEHFLECSLPVEGNPYCPCHCNPKHEVTEYGAMIVIHNSFDGREGVEWVNELLNA